MKKKTFLNNNSILFFSWYCALFCIILEKMIFRVEPYVTFVIWCYLLLVPFIIFSVFYSFYQSIKNININKIYAFLLLIIYLLITWWLYVPYVLLGDMSIADKIFISIYINICFLGCLYLMFKKQSILIVIYLIFYSINSMMLLLFFLNVFARN